MPLDEAGKFQDSSGNDDAIITTTITINHKYFYKTKFQALSHFICTNI